jgi:K+-sensing histidine kinase KdpD
MLSRLGSDDFKKELQFEEIVPAISHELNTGLTTVLGNAHILRTGGDQLGVGARASALADLEHHANRLFKAIQNLLLLARLELGEKPYLQPVVLPRFVEDILFEERLRFSSRRISMATGGFFQPVAIDQSLLRVALFNLLDNADQFSPREAPIEVTAFGGGSIHTILVIDHGSGVDEAERDLIFEPFYRCASIRDKVPGLGLGLTIAQKLAQLHGGDLIFAPHSGGGSSFALMLPPMQVESV